MTEPYRLWKGLNDSCLGGKFFPIHIGYAERARSKTVKSSPVSGVGLAKSHHKLPALWLQLKQNEVRQLP